MKKYIFIIVLYCACSAGTEISSTTKLDVPACDDIGCAVSDLVDPTCLLTGALCVCQKTCTASPGAVVDAALCATVPTEPTPSCASIGCDSSNVTNPSCFTTGFKCGCPCGPEIVTCLPI